MREIKFRGKRIDTGEWVYGDLLRDVENNEAFIAEYFECKSAYLREVTSETVGQYTGLKDKNGVEIYEGDILYFAPYETDSNNKVVEFIGASFSYFFSRSGLVGVLDRAICEQHIVIGNIHQHSELQEGK